MTVFGGDETMANDVNSPKVRLVQQAAGVQTIATSDTTLTFGSGSEDYDTNGWHDETTNPSRITVDRDGNAVGGAAATGPRDAANVGQGGAGQGAFGARWTVRYEEVLIL